MSQRHTGWLRVRGAASEHPELVSIGRKMIGALQNRGLPTNAMHRSLPDGSTVHAQLAGGHPIINVSAPLRAERVEEVVACFITGAEGLNVVDLGSKNRVELITGLQAYEVDAVNRLGTLVYLTGEGIVVRADLPDVSALGWSYSVPYAGGIGYGWADACRLSPDGTKLLVAFDEAYDDVGVLNNRLGGIILADAETLEPLREPIRMGFYGTHGGAACWADDGRFFVAAKVAIDSGTGAPDSSVTTSTNEYIATFDADGALLGTVLVGTWSSPPSSAFSPRIRALAAKGGRLYVLWQKDPFGAGDPQLLAYDIEDPDQPPASIGALVLPIDAVSMPRSIGLHHGAKIALPLVNTDDGKIMEISTAEDVLEVLHTTDRPEFSMSAVTGGTIDNDALQRGAKSRLDNPPDMRRFLLGNDHLYGFRGFDADPAYDLDLTELAVNKRFRLLVTGQRPAVETP